MQKLQQNTEDWSFCRNYYYYYYTRLTASFSAAIWVSRYQRGKTSLDLNKARDDGFWDGSGISWTICKQSAPRSRQTTTPIPHHSIFTGRMLFLTPNQQRQSTEGLQSAESTTRNVDEKVVD